MKTKLAIVSVLLIAFAGSGYWFLHRPAKLLETDTIVLADFTNTTGDGEFEGSLHEALRVALAQSPFLNLASDEKLRDTLRILGGSTDDALTPFLARKICEHVGAKAYITGGIIKSSDGYVVSLDATTCATDKSLAHAESEAGRKDQVVHALGTTASALRKKLGEVQASIGKFDYPLERATTFSLTALQAYSQGRKIVREKGDLEALPSFKKALELDSGFALTHSAIAVSYYNLNQTALAGEEIRQAFEAASRQTTRDRLHITTLYYDLGTGDVQKAIESYKEWARLYPRDDIALGNLSSEYFLLGDYEQAANSARDALRLDPDSAAWYENYSTALIALLRLDEAQSVLNDAFSRKLDDAAMHSNVYDLAFLRGEASMMHQEVAWSIGKPGGEDTLLASQADTEAFAGRLKKARELSRRAVESAQKASLAEPAAIWQGMAALREAAFGNLDEARKAGENILKIAPESRDAQTIAALVFARAGDAKRAQAILDDLRARYVSNTVVQAVWLPTIRAQSELLKHNPTRAIELLEPVTPYERGQLIGNISSSCLVPVYLRGEAYLAMKQGPLALAEFQKIADSRGIIGNCWSGPLARLGQARAYALSGHASASRTAYQEFFTLWKDADPNIPVLKQGKAEYAKLK
jgi:tetratricopeptide (TPR) repeat protein